MSLPAAAGNPPQREFHSIVRAGQTRLAPTIEACARRHGVCLLCSLLEVISQPREQTAPIGRAEHCFDVVLGMRHHAEHVALVVEDSGDGVGRAVEVPRGIKRSIGSGVAEQHPALAFKPRDGLLVGDVVALAVRDRHADHLAGIVAAGERRVGALDAQIDIVGR